MCDGTVAEVQIVMQPAHRVGFLFALVASSWVSLAAHAVPTTLTLLDGTAIPDLQGWTRFQSGSLPPSVTSDGSAVTIDTTVAATGTPPRPILVFHRDLDISRSDGFTIELSLQVHASAHNFADGAVVFYGSYSGPSGGFSGSPSDRLNMIYFDEGEIGWGDLSDTFALDTTDDFHDYRFEWDGTGGEARVFVDGNLALTKSDWELDTERFAFGDSTNDAGVDGRFSIDLIRVTANVPEPNALGWAALLASAAALRRRLAPS